MQKRILIDLLGILAGVLLAIVIICLITRGKRTVPVVTDGNEEISDVVVSDITISEGGAVDAGSNSSTVEGSEISAEKLAEFQTWIDSDFNYGFAMCDYDDVRNINLDGITYNFDEGWDSLGVSRDELIKEYKRATGCSVETDVTMYTDAALSAYLTKWAGITTKDLLYQNTPTSEKYGVYMHQHGDTNARGFTALKGTLIDDGKYAIELMSGAEFTSTMYFVEKDGSYKVVANKLHSCYSYSWNPKMKESDFIFPHSECSYITRADLESKTQQDCKIARNEIFARYGLIFKGDDLKSYFGQFAWYEPRYSSEEINHDTLTLVEKRNIKMIQDYEKEKGWR